MAIEELAFLHDLMGDGGFQASMFAVVKASRNAAMELRFVDVDEDEGTRDFDARLMESGFAPYLDAEAVAASFEESLELKATVGILSVAEVEVSLAEDGGDVASHPIMSFAADIDAAQEAYLHGEIQALVGDEVDKVVGIVFAYSCEAVPDPVFAYQKVQPSAALNRSRFLYKVVGGAAFQLFTGESIKIGTSFDFLFANGRFFAAKPGTLVSQFDYGKVLRRHAETVVAGLGDLVDDAGKIGDRVAMNRKRTINKLLKIRNSPVMNMSAADLKARLEGEELYRGKFRFDERDRVVVEDGNVEDVLKMLNDEILRSPLTNVVYESEIKSKYEGARTQAGE